MASAITFVGAGTASAAVGVAPTPTLPAGLADDDLMLTVLYSREGVDGTVVINPIGDWIEIANDLSSAGILGIWYRFRVTGDLAPTFTIGNHTTGTSGDDIIAQVAAWRGVDPADPIDMAGVVTDWAAKIALGPIEGIAIDRKSLTIIVAGKQDDWTSVTTPATESTPGSGILVWNEISELDSTGGLDAGMAWYYGINTGFEYIIADKTITVSGSGSQMGKGIMISFNLEKDAFVAADHLRAYLALSHPQNDSGIVGGEKNITMRAVFTDLAADDDVEVLSSDVNDTTISCTIRGRDASNVLVTETVTLNGTTAVIFSALGVIDRIESIELSAPTIGDITIRRSVAGATIAVIPAAPGHELGVKRIFAYSYAHPTIAKDYYEKIFFENAHPYYTVANAQVSETSDPQGDLTFALAVSKDDTGTTSSRLTEPLAAVLQSPGTFDNTAKAVPGLNLEPGEGIGIWIKMPVSAAEAAFKDTYQLTLSGEV